MADPDVEALPDSDEEPSSVSHTIGSAVGEQLGGMLGQAVGDALAGLATQVQTDPVNIASNDDEDIVENPGTTGANPDPLPQVNPLLVQLQDALNEINDNPGIEGDTAINASFLRFTARLGTSVLNRVSELDPMLQETQQGNTSTSGTSQNTAPASSSGHTVPIDTTTAAAEQSNNQRNASINQQQALTVGIFQDIAASFREELAPTIRGTN